MMTKEDMFLLAQTTVCDIIATAQDNLVRDLSKPTDEECEAVMAFLFQVATCLEGYLIACLPKKQSDSIRAALDRAAVVFSKRAASVLTQLTEGGIIGVDTDESTDPASTPK